MKILLTLLLLLSASPVSAYTWRLSDSFPNTTAAGTYPPVALRPIHVANGQEGQCVNDDLSTTACLGTVYVLTSWNDTTKVGTFFQEVVPVNDNSGAGTPCAFGVPGGLPYANYGRPGHGYDWYTIDSTGFRYLGWQFFRPDCKVVIGSVDQGAGQPYVFKATYDDTVAQGDQTLYVQQVGTTNCYNSSGTQLHYSCGAGSPATENWTNWLKIKPQFFSSTPYDMGIKIMGCTANHATCDGSNFYMFKIHRSCGSTTSCTGGGSPDLAFQDEYGGLWGWSHLANGIIHQASYLSNVIISWTETKYLSWIELDW